MIIPNCCSILGQKYRSVLAELSLEGCQKHDDDPRKESGNRYSLVQPGIRGTLGEATEKSEIGIWLQNRQWPR